MLVVVASPAEILGALHFCCSPPCVAVKFLSSGLPTPSRRWYSRLLCEHLSLSYPFVHVTMRHAPTHQTDHKNGCFGGSAHGANLLAGRGWVLGSTNTKITVAPRLGRRQRPVLGVTLSVKPRLVSRRSGLRVPDDAMFPPWGSRPFATRDGRPQLNDGSSMALGGVIRMCS